MYNPACKFTFVTFETIVHQLHVRVNREIVTNVKKFYEQRRRHGSMIADEVSKRMDFEKSLQRFVHYLRDGY